MTWYNPKTWKKKAALPYVFFQLAPDVPFQGIDHFSANEKCIYKYAVKITGLTLDEAKAHLTGKVLDWPRLKDKHWKTIESGKPPEMSYQEIKELFR